MTTTSGTNVATPQPLLPHGWVADPCFSPAVGVERPARWVVTGAVAPVAEDGAVLHESDLTAQLALAVENLEAVLAVAQLDLRHVLRLGVTTVDPDELAPLVPMVAERFAAAGARPALSVAGVTALLPAGAMVVLDALAASGS